MSIETYPGAVGGFRIMKLRPDGMSPPKMLSIGRQMGGADYEWKAHERNTMLCGRGREHPGQRPPVWNCRCGFWFYKKQIDLEQRVPVDQYDIGEAAYAMVAGWGKVVEHEEGVRTEFARPVALLDKRPLPENSDSYKPKMSYEKWLKWIGLIQLPIVKPEEIDIAAQMFQIDMLEYTKPVKLVQVIYTDGVIRFQDEKEVATWPHNGMVLPKFAPEGEGLKIYGFDLERQTFSDDLGNEFEVWVNVDAPENVLMHNAAQVERAIRSPYAVL